MKKHFTYQTKTIIRITLIFVVVFANTCLRVIAQTLQGDILPNAKILDVNKIYDFQQGFAVVQKGNDYALIDSLGNFAVPFGNSFKACNPVSEEGGFSNGFCKVRDRNSNKVGYIDLKMKIVVPCKFTDGYKFSKAGKAKVTILDPESKYTFSFVTNSKGEAVYPKPPKISEAPIHPMSKQGFKYAISPRDTEYNYLSDYDEFINGNLHLVQFSFLEFDATGNKIQPKNIGGNSFYGYANIEGKIVIPVKYKWAQKFSDGMAAVAIADENGKPKWGFIDESGKIIIDFKYPNPTNFSEGLACMTYSKADTLIHFIDKKEKIVKELNKNYFMPYLDNNYYENGFAIDNNNQVPMLMNRNSYSYLYPPDVGGDAFAYHSDKLKKFHYGIIPKYTSEGSAYASALKDNKLIYIAKDTTGIKWGYGILNLKTNLFDVMPIFDTIFPYDKTANRSHAIFKNPQTKSLTEGYININGQFTIVNKPSEQLVQVCPGSILPNVKTLNVDELLDFSDGYAVVIKNNKSALINSKGEFVINFKDQIVPLVIAGNSYNIAGFKNGMLVVQDVLSGKIGVLNKELKLIHNCVYESREPRSTGQAGAISDNGFVIGIQGTKTYEPSSNIEIFNRYFLYNDGSKKLIPKIDLNKIVVPIHPASNLGYSYHPSSMYMYQKTSKIELDSYDEAKFWNSDIVPFNISFDEKNSRNSNAQGSGAQGRYCGYIDIKGNIIVQPKFIEAYEFSDGLAAVKVLDQNEKEVFRYINAKGEFATGEIKISEIPSSYRQGLVINTVSSSDPIRNCVFNDKGEVIYRSDKLQSFGYQFNKNFYKIDEHKYFEYNATDKSISEKTFPELNGSFNCTDTTISFSKTYLGEICNNYSGTFVSGAEIKFLFRNKYQHIHGTATISLNGKKYSNTGIGYVDDKFQIFIPPVFSLLGNFDDTSGLTRADMKLDSSNKLIEGYINSQGEFTIIKQQQQ